MNLGSVATGVDGVVRTISGVLRHAGTRAGGMVGHDVSTVASNTAAAAAGRVDPGLGTSSSEDSRDTSRTGDDQTGDSPVRTAVTNVSASTDPPLHTAAEGGVVHPQHDAGVLPPPLPGHQATKHPGHHQAAQPAPSPGTIIPPGDAAPSEGTDSDNSSDPGQTADPSQIAASMPAGVSPQPDPLAGPTPWSTDHHDSGDQQPLGTGMPGGMPGFPGMGGLSFPKSEERTSSRRTSPWSKGKETTFPREKPQQ